MRISDWSSDVCSSDLLLLCRCLMRRSGLGLHTATGMKNMAKPRKPAAFIKDPLWYKDAVVYQVHLKSFYDSNNDGVGDFPGLIEMLDYFADLGVHTRSEARSVGKLVVRTDMSRWRP